ncbi:MAG: hypothetical protein ACKOET_19105 [Verrucomicrobiota bacterium]
MKSSALALGLLAASLAAFGCKKKEEATAAPEPVAPVNTAGGNAAADAITKASEANDYDAVVANILQGQASGGVQTEAQRAASEAAMRKLLEQMDKNEKAREAYQNLSRMRNGR